MTVIARSCDKLRGRLGREARLQIDLLEDDLKEGAVALGAAREFFVGLISSIEGSKPQDLPGLFGDDEVFAHLDYLRETINGVRRRVTRLAMAPASLPGPPDPPDPPDPPAPSRSRVAVHAMAGTRPRGQRGAKGKAKRRRSPRKVKS